MSAPTNVDALSATDLGALPASVSQTVDDAGTTYEVWYKFTAPDGAAVVGAFAFGDLSVYQPTISVYEGPAGSPTTLLDITALNVPIQFPVTPGVEYFLQIVPNGGTVSPANLTLAVEVAPNDAVTAGLIVIPDDTDGFPAALVNVLTGNVVRFINPFPAGENGDVLDDGTMLVEDNTISVVKKYNADFTLEQTIDPFDTATVSSHRIRVSRGLQVFYVGGDITGGAQLTTVNQAGSQGPTWILPDAGLTAIAPNNDGSIIYVAGQGSSINTPVKAWDTGANDFGTDLIAGQGANTFVFDMLVLGDDSIIVGWQHSSTHAITVKRLNASGDVLGTYTTTSTSAASKLAFDPDSDTAHIWLWTHDSDGQSTWTQLETSGMTAASSVTTREYEDGAYQGTATATPDQRFGVSFSCPFFFTRQEQVTVGTIGPYVWVEWPRRVP